MSTLEEALEITGHGKFNHLALITNGFLLQYATTEALGLSYVLNTAHCDLDISDKQRGIVSVATLIGVVAPAILWGSIGDAYGRRAAMLPPTVLAVVCSLMSSFSQDFVSILLLRLFTGLMVSASCATAYVYLGELTSPSRRPAAIAYVATFIAQAYITMPVSAWILLPRKFAIPITDKLCIVPWRVLMWVYTFWGSAACVGMAILPESPAYTLAMRGAPEARAILAKMYSWNQKKTADEYPVQDIHVNHHFAPTLGFALCHLKPMLQPPLLRCFIVTHICNFLVFMQSNTFYAWMPHVMHELLVKGPQYEGQGMCTILNRVHANDDEVLDECAPRNLDPRVYPIATALGVLTFFCYPGIVAGRRKYGNKKMYSIVMAVCGAILLLAAVVPHVTVDIILYGIGLSGITASTVMVNSVLDVFPIRLRALAMSTLFMIGRLGAAVGSQLFGWGLRHHSCIPIVVIITGITAISGILMYQWPDNAKVRAEMIAKDFNY